MTKKILGNFHNYFRKGEVEEDAAKSDEETKGESSPAKKDKFNKDFKIYTTLQKRHGKKGEDIFYTFLNKVYDSSEQEIYEYLPLYLRDLVSSGVLDKESIAKGTSRFIKALPDLSSDVPKISEYFAHTLLALTESKAFNPADLVWLEQTVNKGEGDEEEEDSVFVEAYFKTIAEFLVLHR